MTELDYDALQRLADAATPGPWEGPDEAGEWHSYPPATGAFLVEYGADVDQKMRDIRFIAASRSAVPALLDRVREVTDDRDYLYKLSLKLGQERDAALSTIAKVEALHHKITRYGNDMHSISAESYEDDPSSYEDLEPFDLCAECYEVEKMICEECGGDAPIGHRSNYPCPTARALGSGPSTGEGNE